MISNHSELSPKRIRSYQKLLSFTNSRNSGLRKLTNDEIVQFEQDLTKLALPMQVYSASKGSRLYKVWTGNSSMIYL